MTFADTKLGRLPLSYKTVLKHGTVELEEKRSRFIANAWPVESEAEALERIEAVRKEHPSATHNVPAYQVGYRGNLQRYSDDGEPSGTAGIPVLDVLRKGEVQNTVVVVTRYFGGTKLGAGGLVRAYGSAASAGVRAATVVTMRLFKRLLVEVSYDLLGTVQYRLEQMGLPIEDIEYLSSVTLTALVPFEDVDTVRHTVTGLTSAQGSFAEGGYVFIPQDGDTLLPRAKRDLKP